MVDETYRNIKKTKSNTYAVNIIRNGDYVYCKTFKTLEEAIVGRDNFKNGIIEPPKRYTNITKTKCNTYAVQIMRNRKYTYCKTFKTLDEAIEGRDHFKKYGHQVGYIPY
tara:strand:+ start:313 stop:642 length:330 start_codon:yes stop_codon:yes gene_type:complete